MYQRPPQKKAAETKSADVAPKPNQAASSRAPAWTNAQGNQPPLTLQPKLTVNQPGDENEDEADRVAAQVMRMATPAVTQVQRCACGGIAESDGECAACKAKRLGVQRKSDAVAKTEAPPSVHETLRSSGQPLDEGTRAFMEPRFGADFSDVRVHTDSQAAQSADDVSAHAYTVGNNLVFGAGQYAPGTDAGHQLIAHELTHVVQQQSDLQSMTLQREQENSTEIEESDQPILTKDVFTGKRYDTNTKEGALQYAEDWHTQLYLNYQTYMPRSTDSKSSTNLDFSSTKWQHAGRKFFIYDEYYWPLLKTLAEKATPLEIINATNNAVNTASQDSETEEASATRIDSKQHPKLFPETFAKVYDAEAKRLRIEENTEFDENEKWKLEAAKNKDKEGFVLHGAAQYRRRFVAELHEQEAARIRKGQWDALSFEVHNDFFLLKGREKAEKMAIAEYDLYVNRVNNPDSLWQKALQIGMQGEADVLKQNMNDKTMSAAEKDIASFSIMTTLMRNKVDEKIIPRDVIKAWNNADTAMILLRPAALKGEVSPDSKEKIVKEVSAFYTAFRSATFLYDQPAIVPQGYAEPYVYMTNPYLSPDELHTTLTLIASANDKNSWKMVFERYNNVVMAMDNFIASQLDRKGYKDEGEKLKITAARSRELTNLLEDHPKAKKVQAIFYPQDELENRGTPGTPNFAATGIPLYFYMYRDKNEWNLVDITSPHHIKVTSGSGGNDQIPDMSIFTELDSKLRFSRGKIIYMLPNGLRYTLDTTEPWRLSEWLTWFGIGIAVVGLGVATFGGSIPATVIIIGAGVGAAAGVADIVEKKSAGVLKTKDVIIDGLAITGSILGAGSAKLGKVVLSEAAQAGIAMSEVGGFAGRWFIPVTIAAIGTDLASYAIVTSDAMTTLSEIDKQPGSDEDRKFAKIRIITQLIAMGLITFVAVKSNVSTMKKFGNPLLNSEELLLAKGIKNPKALIELLSNENLPQDLRGRIGAALVEAITGNSIVPLKLEQLIGRMHTATTAEAVNAVLTELSARSRIGSICGGEVAAKLTADDAILLASLEESKFNSLKGASLSELRTVTAALTPDLAKQRTWITKPVSGFAEGLDTNKRPKNWKFIDKPIELEEDGTQVLRTDVIGPMDKNGHRPEGFFVTAYNPKTKKLELRMAFVRQNNHTIGLPNKIPKQGNAPELIAGQGTPTVQYMTVRQMKILGVPVGEAAANTIKFHLDAIEDVQTIVHLHWLRQRFPERSVSSLLEFTETMKRAETTVAQTGYKRAGELIVNGGKTKPISEILKLQEGSNRQRQEENEALLKKYGFNRDTEMYVSFDIDFPVIKNPIKE